MSAAEDAFVALMAIAGRERPDFTTIEQGLPALATRFCAEDAAAAALAAGGAIAADIWRLRTGESQTVTVATREAAAGLRSYLYQRFDDATKAPPPMRSGGGDDARALRVASGPMRTGDGRWIYLHPSFPDSARRMLAVIGDPADRAAAEAATREWTALDLENAIADARACAGMVRTPEEWDASEQGRILAARPVVEVIKIAESPPEPFTPAPDMPLSGVRALDLTRVLAGPTCARTLAQYGADVLYLASPNLPATLPFITDTNHGKLSAWLDLDDEAGRRTLRDLVRTSDVFSQGYRAGALERRGFGPLALHDLRPGIVYTAINAYGHEGPWRSRAGWEQLAQTVTGMSYMHGRHVHPEGEPTLQPGAVTDYGTGFLAAFGTMVALVRRARYGGSYMVRVSLSQTGVWIRKLGLADEGRLAATAPTEDEVSAWTIRSPRTDWGPMSHLRPAVRMSATPPRWKRPVARLGAHAPAWPIEDAPPARARL
jgi:crotonobetainyl-CoA:carnitine CoA-transferase CaiB-like acyl-CoA transferase